MMDQPYLVDLSGGGEGVSRHDKAEARAIAAREAMEREQALYGTPPITRAELPPIKKALLPPDYAARLAQLDERISRRGVFIDVDRLRQKGRERFQTLLALDRKARSWQRLGDLTRFEAVQYGLEAFQAPDVPRRTTTEQLGGYKKELDVIRQISGWEDLWKATAEKRETLADVYAFHDAFNVLLFGHSMLEQIHEDGRAYSPLLRGGSGEKVDLFRQWLTVLKGKHVSVTLTQPLWHIVSWLANERAALPSLTQLARDWFNLRAPSKEQVQIASAVLDGFLLDYEGWHLWEYVGRVTRASQNDERLRTWRSQLSKRFTAITSFHAELRSAFHRTVGFGIEAHLELDAPRWRGFLDSTVQRLNRQASALLALGTEETFPGAAVARFQGSVLVEDKHKLKDKRVQIGLPLAKAFPASSFQLEFQEVRA
jgi:hypothetical protein